MKTARLVPLIPSVESYTIAISIPWSEDFYLCRRLETFEEWELYFEKLRFAQSSERRKTEVDLVRTALRCASYYEEASVKEVFVRDNQIHISIEFPSFDDFCSFKKTIETCNKEAAV